MSDEFPPMIGKYKVIGIIAKGGMGVVYKAIHPSLKRYVVIKKMTARGNSTNAERFKKKLKFFLICKVHTLFTFSIILQRVDIDTW